MGALWRPGPLVKLGAVVSYLIGALPAVLALTLSRPSVPSIACGVLVSVQLVLTSRTMARHNRTIRQLKRLFDDLRFAVTFLVAVGPVGAWLAGLWLATPLLHAYGGAALIALSLSGWLLRAALGKPWFTWRWLKPVSKLLDGLDFLLLRRGLLAFLVGVVFHTRPELVTAALGLAGAQLVPLLWGGIVGRYSALWTLDLTYALGQPVFTRELVLRHWAYDALVAPRRPDDSLLRLAVTQALIGVAGRRTEVEPLLRFVDDGLEVVEYGVLPDLSGRRRAAVAGRVDALRAYTASAKAQAAIHQGRWEEAGALMTFATSTMRDMGLPNLAALGEVGLLAHAQFQNVDTLPDLVRLAEDESLTLTMRRTAMYAAAFFAMTLDDAEQMTTLYHRAEAMHPRRRDRAVLLAEMRAERGKWLPSWAMRNDLEQARLIEAHLAGSVRQEVEGVVHLPRLGATNTLIEAKEIGRLAVQAGMFEEGARILRSVAADAELRGHPYTLFEATYWLAVAQVKSDPAAAYASVRTAMETYDLFRAGLVRPSHYDWLGGLTLAHMLALQLLTRGEEVQAIAAFDVAEQARARGMLELLGSSTPAPPGSPDLSASDAYAEALRAWESDTSLEALERVRATWRELNALWTQMVASGGAAAEYAQLRQARPIAYEQARSLLERMGGERRVVAFEYHMTSDAEMVLFVIRADLPEPQVVPIPIEHAELRRGPERAQEALRAFLEPVARWSDPGDLLCIVPFSAMHAAAIHAVTVDGAPLIERNPVCYVPSLTVLQHCEGKRTGRTGRALVMADSRSDQPLPHARIQAAAIGELFGEAVTLVGGEATLESLTSSPGADVVHLACHGEFQQGDPLRSGILLSTGVATIAAFMELRLRANLVTLSACQSGMSENEAGEELIGLARAAIYAGTPSVLATLWSVDEISTSVLMRSFYTLLLGGADKADAIRQAQLSTRDMTSEQVVAYCEESKYLVDGPSRWLLDRDIADARFRARDFAAALHDYEVLTTSPDLPDDALQPVRLAQARCRRAMRRPAPVDYGVRPFHDPYYWAPFVLIGDWR